MSQNDDEHGQVYADVDGGETVAVAAADTWYELAAGNVAANSLKRYSDPNATTGRITLSKGKHLVCISASVLVTSGKVIEMTALKNGAQSVQVLASLTSDGGREAMVAFGIIESDGTDYISLGFLNQTDTTDVSVKQATIVHIGLDTNPPRPGTR